jgi:hypothetical protein
MHPKIAFYLARDGEDATRLKIREQLETCLRSVVSSESHGSLTEYRGIFVDDALAYARYLGPEAADAALQVVFSQLQGKRSTATGRQALLSDQLLHCEAMSTLDTIEALRFQPQAPNTATPALSGSSDGDRLTQALARLREHGIACDDI